MNDIDYIRHCLTLANQAVDAGELAFGALIVRNNQIFVESKNQTKALNDVTAHAEIQVIRQAQQLLNSTDLSDCTLYSNLEPCAMCSFMIREMRISRVVFAMPSPLMGGYTKWPILQDQGLARLKPYFDDSPNISWGILEKEARIPFFENITPEPGASQSSDPNYSKG